MSTCASVSELNASLPDRSRSWAPAGACQLRRLITAILLAVATVLVSTGAAQADVRQTTHVPCDYGVFCSWPDKDYRGAPHLSDPRTTPLEKCVPMPKGREASSFINRTDRPVTVYQDPTCSTEADFKTYPAGSFVPQAPYVVRAIQIWSH
jgi:hypothetical protein